MSSSGRKASFRQPKLTQVERESEEFCFPTGVRLGNLLSLSLIEIHKNMSKKQSFLATLRLLLFLTIIYPFNSNAEFLISEIVADNSGTTLSDEDGFPADWLEIQNPEPSTASIAGYYLTDDPAVLTKWQLPDVSISGNGFLVVFATGKNRAVSGSELHANFSLGAGGEYLALVKPDGETVVSSFDPEFPAQLQDISYGTGSGGPVAGADFLLVGAEVAYLVPDSDIGSTWQEPSFDDAAWAISQTAFGWGYSSAVGDEISATGDISNVMRGTNGSVYMRLPFQVTDPAEMVSMTLKVKVDDGFVAYINGTKVAEKNAPSPLSYNSVATVSEEVDVGENFEFFPLNFAGALVQGENILALQAMNSSASSSDFIIIPELVGEIQDLSAPAQLGYFEEPTPGAPNGILSLAPPNLVQFSVTGRAFTQNFSLELSVLNPDAVIRYTTDGSMPTAAPASPSPVYNSPVTISGSTMVRAKAFLSGAIEGPGRTEGYMKLDPSQADFSSDLPIVLLHKFSSGQPPGANASSRVPGFMLIYEPDPETGRTTLTSEPTLGTRCGYRKRGSSSGGFSKYAMALESWNEFNEDVDIKPLGFSAEGDWILNSRFTFDQSLMRNPFLYALSNQIDRWAVKTQFIEIFHDATGGDITASDYFGVYTFMEKIEPDKGRLDIPSVNAWDNSEPDVTGGYVFKRDRSGVGEQSLNAAGSGGAVPLTSPNIISTPQRDYIQGYLAEMNSALNAPNGISSTGKHFSEYMDVGAWIDNFWLNILAMDPDWGRLSQYFYKERNGPVSAGPIWDYDRTMGSDDGRDDNPRQWDTGNPTWYASNYPWFGKLFGFKSNNQPTPAASSTRPDVMQQVVDRWFELRAAEFGQSNMETIINGMADEIREAQARSFARWRNPAPGSISGQNFSEAGTTGWERDVSHLKGWLKARSEWIDQQFFLPPTFNKNGGVVEEGFQLTMNSNDATVYYMTDGSDPRAPGGGTAIGAIPFDGGPIDEVLLAEDSSCQYFVPLDASLQTTWFLPEFEDTDWFSGTSGLGFESLNGVLNSEITTNIKSTMQPSANGSRNASAYFRFKFDFDNADSINRLLLEIKYDDSFVAYLNGTEIARSNSAPASIAWNSSGSSGPSDSTLVNYSFNGIADNSALDYDITANKALIINGTNVLALQVMNSSSGGSDFLVKPRISANHTVIATPIVVNSSSTIVARAYDGQQWGGPTSATFVVGSELADATNLVVSEVMYNPIGATAAEINAGFLDGDLFEYVELLNISASPIDLSEVSFSNGIDFDFLGAAITELDPDARLLVVRNQAAFEQRYGVGFSNLIAGEFANDTNLANSGERVAIGGASGVIRDFRYDDTAPWPLLPDGFGPSLVLLAPNSNLDHSLSESWAASTAPLGSPGEGDGGTTFSGDPNADIDNDGLSAFAEYAFGTSDTDPAAGKGIVTTSVDDDGLFTVSFPKNSNATDAQIGVEISGDLIDWTPAGAMLALDSVIYNGDGTATVTYKSANPVAQGDRLFVRLRTSSL